MVPIHDDNPIQIDPWVTKILIAVNIVVFAIEVVVATQPEQLEQFFHAWAFVPCHLTDTCPPTIPASTFNNPVWLTLITSQFLHGGIGHIAGNMLYLGIFGNNVEECLGHVKFLIFYIACGVLAALAQGFFTPTSAIPTLGASGAIAGVLGAYLIRFPRAKLLILPFFPLPIPIRIPAFFFLVFWFLLQFINGVASFNLQISTGEEVGGVAYWAHAGGFIFGAFLGSMMGLFRSPQRRRRE